MWTKPPLWCVLSCLTMAAGAMQQTKFALMTSLTGAEVCATDIPTTTLWLLLDMIMQCAMQCLIVPTCMAYNFNARTGQCDLYQDRFPTSYVTVKGCKGYQIDQCSTNNVGCSSDATCKNVPGSSACVCKAGFFGNGFTCTACQIGALSWGNSDITRYTGYIALNSKKVISTLTVHDWGFILVELNVSSCSALKAQVYNTFSSSTNGSENMAYYIKGLPLYTVLIGITSYDPYLSLTQNAKSALISIGANLTGMQRESKMCFAAQIGQPAMFVSKMASPGGFNLNITVNVAENQGTQNVTFIQL